MGAIWNFRRTIVCLIRHIRIVDQKNTRLAANLRISLAIRQKGLDREIHLTWAITISAGDSILLKDCLNLTSFNLADGTAMGEQT
jgi:hypothetical protein